MSSKNLRDFFEDVNFVPASETEKGVAEIATLEECRRGVNSEKIVTPAGLAYAIPQATEQISGKAKIAAATLLGSLDNTTIISPLRLLQYCPDANEQYAGRIRNSTTQEAINGIIDNAFVSPLKLNQVLGAKFPTTFFKNSNGYYIFPGGFIIQWGTAAKTTAEQTFPKVFPTNCFSIVQAGTEAYERGQKIIIVSPSSFKLTGESVRATTWIAIGW